MPDHFSALMNVPLTKTIDPTTTRPLSLEHILKVVSADIESLESKICLDAVLLGADTAIEKHDVQDVNIICNNQDIKVFAKKFAGKTVSL